MLQLEKKKTRTSGILVREINITPSGLQQIKNMKIIKFPREYLIETQQNHTNEFAWTKNQAAEVRLYFCRMNSNETHNKAANFIKPTAVYFKSIQDLVQFINERIMNFEHMSLDQSIKQWRQDQNGIKLINNFKEYKVIKSKERDKNMEEILMLSVEIRTFDKRRIKEVMNNLKEFGKLRKMEEMEKQRLKQIQEMENKKRRRKSLISRLNDKIAVTYLMNMLDMVKEFSYRQEELEIQKLEELERLQREDEEQEQKRLEQEQKECLCLSNIEFHLNKLMQEGGLIMKIELRKHENQSRKVLVSQSYYEQEGNYYDDILPLYEDQNNVWRVQNEYNLKLMRYSAMDELVIDIYRPRENAEELNNDEENGSAIESKLQFYQKICHIQPIRIAKLINHLQTAIRYFLQLEVSSYFYQDNSSNLSDKYPTLQLDLNYQQYSYSEQIQQFTLNKQPIFHQQFPFLLYIPSDPKVLYEGINQMGFNLSNDYQLSNDLASLNQELLPLQQDDSFLNLHYFISNISDPQLFKHINLYYQEQITSNLQYISFQGLPSTYRINTYHALLKTDYDQIIDQALILKLIDPNKQQPTFYQLYEQACKYSDQSLLFQSILPDIQIYLSKQQQLQNSPILDFYTHKLKHHQQQAIQILRVVAYQNQLNAFQYIPISIDLIFRVLFYMDTEDLSYPWLFYITIASKFISRANINKSLISNKLQEKFLYIGINLEILFIQQEQNLFADFFQIDVWLRLLDFLIINNKLNNKAVYDIGSTILQDCESQILQVKNISEFKEILVNYGQLLCNSNQLIHLLKYNKVADNSGTQKQKNLYDFLQNKNIQIVYQMLQDLSEKDNTYQNYNIEIPDEDNISINQSSIRKEIKNTSELEVMKVVQHPQISKMHLFIDQLYVYQNEFHDLYLNIHNGDNLIRSIKLLQNDNPDLQYYLTHDVSSTQLEFSIVSTQSYSSAIFEDQQDNNNKTIIKQLKVDLNTFQQNYIYQSTQYLQEIQQFVQSKHYVRSQIQFSILLLGDQSLDSSQNKYFSTLPKNYQSNTFQLFNSIRKCNHLPVQTFTNVTKQFNLANISFQNDQSAFKKISQIPYNQFKYIMHHYFQIHSSDQDLSYLYRIQPFYLIDFFTNLIILLPATKNQKITLLYKTLSIYYPTITVQIFNQFLNNLFIIQNIHLSRPSEVLAYHNQDYEVKILKAILKNNSSSIDLTEQFSCLIISNQINFNSKNILLFDDKNQIFILQQILTQEQKSKIQSSILNLHIKAKVGTHLRYFNYELNNKFEMLNQFNSDPPMNIKDLMAMNHQIVDLSFYDELSFDEFANCIRPYIPSQLGQPNGVKFVELSIQNEKVHLQPKNFEEISGKEYMNNQIKMDDLVKIYSPMKYQVWFLENEDTYKQVNLPYSLLSFDDIIRFSNKENIHIMVHLEAHQNGENEQEQFQDQALMTFKDYQQLRPCEILKAIYKKGKAKYLEVRYKEIPDSTFWVFGKKEEIERVDID